MDNFIHGGKLELVTELQGKSDFLLALTCSEASVAPECLTVNLFLPISDLSSVTLKKRRSHFARPRDGGGVCFGAKKDGRATVRPLEQRRPRKVLDLPNQLPAAYFFCAGAHVSEKHGVTKTAAGGRSPRRCAGCADSHPAVIVFTRRWLFLA